MISHLHAKLYLYLQIFVVSGKKYMTLDLYCALLYIGKGKFSSSPPDFFDWISGCRY